MLPPSPPIPLVGREDAVDADCSWYYQRLLNARHGKGHSVKYGWSISIVLQGILIFIAIWEVSCKSIRFSSTRILSAVHGGSSEMNQISDHPKRAIILTSMKTNTYWKKVLKILQSMCAILQLDHMRMSANSEYVVPIKAEHHTGNDVSKGACMTPMLW